MTLRFSGAIALLIVGFACSSASAAVPSVSIQSVKGDFDDVRERVVMAIESRGLVLNYTAKIGNMLERTGKDVGSERKVYGKAELLEFCSAIISRRMMEADPRNIVYCPYAIAVYTLPNDPAKVHVAYRRPSVAGSGPSLKSLREVGKLLDDIVRDALK